METVEVGLISDAKLMLIYNICLNGFSVLLIHGVFTVLRYANPA
jgi:hypothetical protein